MSCWNCSAAILPEHRFCPICGVKAGDVVCAPGMAGCRRCSAEVAMGSSFCPNCGVAAPHDVQAVEVEQATPLVAESELRPTGDDAAFSLGLEAETVDPWQPWPASGSEALEGVAPPEPDDHPTSFYTPQAWQEERGDAERAPWTAEPEPAHAVPQSIDADDDEITSRKQLESGGADDDADGDVPALLATTLQAMGTSTTSVDLPTVSFGDAREEELSAETTGVDLTLALTEDDGLLTEDDEGALAEAAAVIDDDVREETLPAARDITQVRPREDTQAPVRTGQTLVPGEIAPQVIRPPVWDLASSSDVSTQVPTEPPAQAAIEDDAWLDDTFSGWEAPAKGATQMVHNPLLASSQEPPDGNAVEALADGSDDDDIEEVVTDEASGELHVDTMLTSQPAAEQPQALAATGTQVSAPPPMMSNEPAVSGHTVRVSALPSLGAPPLGQRPLSGLTTMTTRAKVVPVQPVQLRFIGLDGRTLTVRKLLPAQVFTLSRDPKQPWATDTFLEAPHASVAPAPGGLAIERIFSSRGAFVQLTATQELEVGDVVRVGETTITVGQDCVLQLRPEGGTPSTCEVKASGCTVGRDHGEVVLPEDTYLSGEHCRFFTQRGKLQVEDLGSSNGTYRMLRAGERVDFGALVLMGHTQFVVEPDEM